MKQIRKILSVAAVLAVMLMIHFGIPNQASAMTYETTFAPVYIPIDQFFYTTPAIFDQAVLLSTTSTLTAPTLAFNNAFYGAGLLNSLSATGGVTFSNDVTLGGALLVNGATSFVGSGSNAMGYTVSPPHPPRDDAYGADLAQKLVTAFNITEEQAVSLLDLAVNAAAINPSSITPGAGAYGVTVSPPHPRGFESLADAAVFVNGNVDVTNLTLDISNLVSGHDWQRGDFMALFVATGNITGTQSVNLIGGAGWGTYYQGVDDSFGVINLGSPVPEPSTILLLGAGLLGLAGIGIMRRKKIAVK